MRTRKPNRATQEMKAKYPFLSRDYLLEEATLGMWANEQETPCVEESASTGSVVTMSAVA